MAAIEKRTAQDGAVSYRVKVRLKGKPTQSATFERLTDAKKWAASIESAIREGRHFTKAEAKRHTLADLIDRYTRDVLPTKREGKKQTGQLRWWKNQIGVRIITTVGMHLPLSVFRLPYALLGVLQTHLKSPRSFARLFASSLSEADRAVFRLPGYPYLVMRDFQETFRRWPA